MVHNKENIILSGGDSGTNMRQPGSSEKNADQHGLYIYCLADGGKEVNLGRIGIEENEVYSISCGGLSAIVHNSEARPYDDDDKGVVSRWVISHQNVIDSARQKFGTVIPFAFDTIVIGEDDIKPEDNLEKWILKDYEKLQEQLNKFRGKSEYGIQVLWDPNIIIENIAQNTPEIKKLKEELKTKTSGTAFMYEQKLKNMLRKKMENKADEYFKNYYALIKEEVSDIHIDKPKKVDGDLQMLMNISCLAFNENEKRLGSLLEEIENKNGLKVRFTGPWPPYSFA